jgi:hypothetical protein
MRELKAEDLDAWLRLRYKNLADKSGYELAEAFHRVVMPG